MVDNSFSEKLSQVKLLSNKEFNDLFNSMFELNYNKHEVKNRN